MSFEEFAARVREIESSETDNVTRRNADAWLSALRSDAAASDCWLSVVPMGLSSSDPLLVTHSAQLLAYKVRHSRVSTEINLSMLELAVSSLLRIPAVENNTVTIRALCAAVAALLLRNLDVQDVQDSLSVIASNLSPQIFLELVTILPGECEDAYEREQRPGGNVEVGLRIKQQANGWCINVVAWLCNMHKQGQSGEEAIQIVRCWTAWVHWGALHSGIPPEQADYLFRVSSFLLLSNPTRPDAGAVGTEAICEVIERIPEASILFDALVRLVVEIPRLVRGWLGSIPKNPGNVPYIFALFCSTFSTYMTNMSQEAFCMRNELLGMISMLVQYEATVGFNGEEEAEEEAEDEAEDFDIDDSATVSMLDALGDVLEAYLSTECVDGGPVNKLTMEEFATKVVSVILTSVQDIPSFRDRIVYCLGMCCEIIGPERYLAGLAELCDGAIRCGPGSAAQVDVILFAAWSVAQTLTETFKGDRHTHAALSLWNAGSIVSSASSVTHHMKSHHKNSQSGTLLFQYDILCYFGTFAKIIVPHYNQSHRLNELITTILHQHVTTAITSFCENSFHQSRSLQDKMRVAATRAVVSLFRVVNSSLPDGAQTTRSLVSDFLVTTDLLLNVMVQTSESYTSELSSLLGIPLSYMCTKPTDDCNGVVHAASALLTTRILEPLAHAAAGQPVEYLHKVLTAVDALMTAIEEEVWSEKSCEPYSCCVVAEALLVPTIQHWMSITESYRAELGSSSSANDEDVPVLLSSIMASCVRIYPEYIAPGLKDVLAQASIIMLQPLKGSSAMHKVFCTALDIYGDANAPTGMAETRQTLLLAFANLLHHPRVAALGNLWQGDIDPDLALAVLSIAAAYVRSTLSSWLEASQNESEEILLFSNTIELVLKLGISNMGSNHRDIAQRSLSLVLAILRACRQPGNAHNVSNVATFYAPIILKQLNVDVSRLPTAAALPKMVSILTEIALLAKSVVETTCPGDLLASNPDDHTQAVYYKSGMLSVLRNWSGESDSIGFDWEPAIEKFTARNRQSHDELRRCIQVGLRNLYEYS